MKAESNVPVPMKIPQVQFTEASRSQPVYGRQAVGVVAGLVAVTAAGCGVCLLMLALGLELSRPWQWGAAGAGLGAMVGLAVGLDKFDLLAVHTEEIVNQPTRAEAPAAVEDVAPWVLLDERGNLRRKGEWGIRSDLVTAFLQAGLAEGPLGFTAWVARFSMAYPGQGRDRYQGFRQKLIAQGYARDWKGSRGLGLTEEGMDYAANWLERHGHLRQLDDAPPPRLLEAGEAEDGADMQASANKEEW